MINTRQSCAFYRLNSYDKEKILYYLPPEKRTEGKRVTVKRLFHQKATCNVRQFDLFFRAKSLIIIYIIFPEKYIIHIEGNIHIVPI